MSSGLPVCARCGAITTSSSPSCEVCGASGAMRAPSPRPDRYFVGIRARFTCRACGFLAPLDGIDASGSAHCVRCGVDQAFDGRQWRAALAFAHGVGDLAGPSLEGLHPSPRIAIDSPWSDIARTRTAVALDAETAPGVLHLRAFPGHPLCARCAKPLSVATSTPGALIVSCVCGLQEEHHLGADVRPGAVLGAIGSGHRAGQVAPAAVESGTAFQCPTCGAPLPVDGKARILTCAFCHVASRIPDAAFRKVAAVDPETIWIAFTGPSARRRELEHEAEEAKIATPQPVKPSSSARALTTAWRLGLPTAALVFAIGAVAAVWWGPQALGIALGSGLSLP